MGGDRREDVAAVEARRDGRQVPGRIGDRARLDRPAEPVGGDEEEPVVGAHERVAARDADGHRQSLRPHPGVDDGDVDADRQVLDRGGQCDGTVADRERPDRPRELEHPRVGADRQHDARADGGGRVAVAEVGEDGDEGSVHGEHRTGVRPRSSARGSDRHGVRAQERPKRRPEEYGRRFGSRLRGRGGGRIRTRCRDGIHLCADRSYPSAHMRRPAPAVCDASPGRDGRAVTGRTGWAPGATRRAAARLATCASGRSSSDSSRRGLFALWALAAALVLLGYRPGGPYDLVVGAAATLPAIVAAVAFLRPALVRGSAAFAGVVWLALGAALLLIPSIAGIVERIGTTRTADAPAVLRGRLSVAPRPRGDERARRDRDRAAVRGAGRDAGRGGSRWPAVVAVAHLRRRRDGLRGRRGRERARPPGQAGDRLPVRSHGRGRARRLRRPRAAGTTAQPRPRALGRGGPPADRDRRARRERGPGRLAWTAEVAGDLGLGRHGAVRLGEDAWSLEPRGAWTGVPAGGLDDATVDLVALEEALPAAVRPRPRTAGSTSSRAPARGTAASRSTGPRSWPRSRRPAGSSPTSPRSSGGAGRSTTGSSSTGQWGSSTASIGGEPGALEPGALQGEVRARMTATDRGAPVTLEPPPR